MKKIIATIYLLKLFACFNEGNAQTVNWNAIDKTSHIFSINAGLDFSLSYGMGYGYMLSSKLPIVLSIDYSTAAGETMFDDFKTKFGAQARLFRAEKFAGAVGVKGIYRRHQTDFVRLQNFGSDVNGTIGFYTKKWFLSTEIGFDKAIVTHFKHSDKYKEEINSDVVDGWYQTATGGNFYYGLQTGLSFLKMDVTLKAGKMIQQDFTSKPALPFYGQIGLNVKLGN